MKTMSVRGGSATKQSCIWRLIQYRIASQGLPFPLCARRTLRLEKCGLLCLAVMSFLCSGAQNKTVSDYLQVSGYVKDMGTLSFTNDINSIYPSSLLHNRIDLKIKPVSHFSIVAGLRTRILVSDYQNLVPNFAQEYAADNGIVKMSFNWVNKYPVLFNTTIDRLYLDWNNDKWDVRVGRQRLNWGINLTWNPNDIFNSYNLLDFDYEERPGADAVKVQYNFTSFSNLEMAFVPSRSPDSLIGALKYAFNTHNYDLQFIGGNYCKDIVLGMGWAGNIKEAGFKGEISYFHGWRDNRFVNDAVSTSVTVDYSLKNGFYMAGSFLYNNSASNNIFSTAQLQNDNLSPKLLMPAKYNFMIQGQQQISPVVNASAVFLYSPVVNLFVIGPTVSYSIATNFDLDLIIQSYFANNMNNKFDVLGNSINMRIKWSFSN